MAVVVRSDGLLGGSSVEVTPLDTLAGTVMHDSAASVPDEALRRELLSRLESAAYEARLRRRTEVR